MKYYLVHWVETSKAIIIDGNKLKKKIHALFFQ